MHRSQTAQAAAAALALVACAPHVPPDLVPTATPSYRTVDGWTLDLRHYPADGPPVMLVHGMGANHYNWDYRAEISLAHHLQQAGWDVWVPELRGDSGSDAPSPRASRNYTFDDHALLDLPAAMDAVLAATGADTLAWVGHSMGGLLLYAALATDPDRISAGVSIGAPAHFHTQNRLHRSARVGGWLLPARGQLHNRRWYRLTRFLGPRNPITSALANRENLDWPLVRSVATVGLENMSLQTVDQVHTWLRTGELLTVDGAPWIQPADVPVLALAGSVDKVAPWPDVADVCTVYADCTFTLLGRNQGHSTDYGHVDMVVGQTSAAEVYPLITDFLDARGRPTDTGPAPAPLPVATGGAPISAAMP